MGECETGGSASSRSGGAGSWCAQFGDESACCPPVCGQVGRGRHRDSEGTLVVEAGCEGEAQGLSVTLGSQAHSLPVMYEAFAAGNPPQ